MNIFDMAARAGLQVLLDARIGNETYHSVSGSVVSLQRFADAIAAATLADLPRAPPGRAGMEPFRPHRAVASKRRARHRIPRCRRQSAPPAGSSLLISGRSGRLTQLFPNRVGKKALRLRQ